LAEDVLVELLGYPDIGGRDIGGRDGYEAA